MSFIQNYIKNISNIPGWSTNKKIVVFEVDDWGAVRTRSKKARDRMIQAGMNIQSNRFDFFDSIAGKEDLEALFEVLQKHKDMNGHSAVFTAVSVVANPDFEKIKASGFTEYHYETLDVTLERYFGNNSVLSLWREGIDAGIFHPEFHGREHLNPSLWLEVLQSGDKNVMTAFNNESLGIKSPLISHYSGGYMSAFDFKDDYDLQKQKQIIEEGLAIFKEIVGYPASHFTSSGLIHHPTIERFLFEHNIKFIDIAKKQLQPQGSGIYKKRYYKLGQKNQHGQFYIARNSRFEPNDKSQSDWVSSSLNDIAIAFRWRKPAIISSHRVNYVGQIDPKNREDGLNQLDSLLDAILKKWPDVEFMSVSDLGKLIEFDQ